MKSITGSDGSEHSTEYCVNSSCSAHPGRACALHAPWATGDRRRVPHRRDGNASTCAGAQAVSPSSSISGACPVSPLSLRNHWSLRQRRERERHLRLRRPERGASVRPRRFSHLRYTKQWIKEGRRFQCSSLDSYGWHRQSDRWRASPSATTTRRLRLCHTWFLNRTVSRLSNPFI